jgi:hypothetical protein
MYEVESYEQVKADLADYPDIIFPDISKYEESGVLEYWVGLYPADRRIKNGYEIWTFDDIPAPSAIGTAFSYVVMGSHSIEHYKDELNPAPPLDANMTYRTVPMEFFEFEIADEDLPVLYPDGSRVGVLDFCFDLSGYRYMINVHVLLTPDEQATITYDEKMALAYAELLVLVDDILDKGGVPR